MQTKKKPLRPMYRTLRTFKPRADGFRSGLEARIAKQIEAAGQPVVYEKLRIPYTKPSSAHKYTPDFQLENSVIVEAKGVFDAEDRKKHILLKEQHPNLDVRFVFSSAKKPINPGSPTTVADWCRKYGFQFAEKDIPQSWFCE